MEKKNIEKCPHIRSLKDVKELNLTLNPVYEDKPDVGGTGTFKDWNVTPWICPVVGLEMNGKHRFCVIWDCGCVISEKALLEVKSDVCHKCAKPFEKLGVLVNFLMIRFAIFFWHFFICRSSTEMTKKTPNFKII